MLPDIDQISRAVNEIVTARSLTKGRFIRDLEEEVADYFGVKHVVGVSSCTSGLILALQAINISPGEVLVPSYTFMATICALVWNRLTPVFVDVEPLTANVDPERVREAITARTRAIMAVHNHGNPVDLDALLSIANQHAIPLIIDSAHAMGGIYNGVKLGRQGIAQIFSLSPTKLLVAGEGGLVATDDSQVAEHIRAGREYGNHGKYCVNRVGLNARMPEFNAALALLGLRTLDHQVESRNRTANYYLQRLRRLPGVGFQTVLPRCRSSYKDFVLFIDVTESRVSRDAIAERLRVAGVDCRTYWNPPAHLQLAFNTYACADDLRVTESLSQRCLAIPIWSEMPEDVSGYVCSIIEDAFR
jgi:dTDP-4-amino-4,6-dideoxygalactose transaminase